MLQNTRTAICTIFLRSIVISPAVCLSVHEHISGTAGPIGTKFCVQIPCGRGSVHIRRRCAMSCTSGFMDDVTIALNGQYGVAWPVWAATSCQLRVRPGRSMMSMNACFLLLSCGHRSLLWVYDSQTHSSRSSDLYHKKKGKN